MGKKAGKIALGLGLITGAITGLLTAPESGKNIRKKIAKGDTEGLLDDLQIMGNELVDMAKDLAKKPSVVEAVDVTKDKVAEMANVERAELDAFMKKVNKQADDLKKKAAKFVKEQKALLDKKEGKKKSTKKKSTKKKSTAKKSTSSKKATPKKKTAKKTSTKKKS